MLDEARVAGLEVALEITGKERRLPASVDQSAYRIVQESITNAIKHAPGAPASVAIEYAPAELRLDIWNGAASDASPAHKSGGGHGLAGMKERVALFGGTLEACTTSDGGFMVKVSLPVEGAA